MKRDTKLLIAAAGLLAATVMILTIRGDSSAIVWRGFLVGMPFYLLPTLAAIWIVKTVRERRRRGRVARGLCASCGYDIRATPNRCPECAPIATPASLRLL